MHTNNNRAVEITLVNQLGYERIAMACSASFAQLFGFPKNRIEDLKTIVSEASINAMQHGNKGRNDAKVKVALSCVEDTINVQVSDEGSGIEEFPPNPDIENIIEGREPLIGFGLFLIKQLTDRVEFNKMTGKGNMVNMSINMKEQV